RPTRGAEPALVASRELHLRRCVRPLLHRVGVWADSRSTVDPCAVAHLHRRHIVLDGPLLLGGARRAAATHELRDILRLDAALCACTPAPRMAIVAQPRVGS